MPLKASETVGEVVPSIPRYHSNPSGNKQRKAPTQRAEIPLIPLASLEGREVSAESPVVTLKKIRS